MVCIRGFALKIVFSQSSIPGSLVSLASVTLSLSIPICIMVPSTAAVLPRHGMSPLCLCPYQQQARMSPSGCLRRPSFVQ